MIDPEAFLSVDEHAHRIADKLAVSYREHGVEPMAWDHPENMKCAVGDFARARSDRDAALAKAALILALFTPAPITADAGKGE